MAYFFHCSNFLPPPYLGFSAVKRAWLNTFILRTRLEPRDCKLLHGNHMDNQQQSQATAQPGTRKPELSFPALKKYCPQHCSIFQPRIPLPPFSSKYLLFYSEAQKYFLSFMYVYIVLLCLSVSLSCTHTCLYRETYIYVYTHIHTHSLTEPRLASNVLRG